MSCGVSSGRGRAHTHTRARAHPLSSQQGHPASPHTPCCHTAPTCTHSHAHTHITNKVDKNNFRAPAYWTYVLWNKFRTGARAHTYTRAHPPSSPQASKATQQTRTLNVAHRTQIHAHTRTHTHTHAHTQVDKNNFRAPAYWTYVLWNKFGTGARAHTHT